MRMLAGGYMEKPNGFSNIQVAPQCRGPPMSLPPKVPPSQAAPLYCAPLHAPAAPPQKQQLDIPKSSSTNVLIDEQPSWVEDLLNEPESPVKNKGHRRAASDPFACLDPHSRAHELWLRNIMGGPTPSRDIMGGPTPTPAWGSFQMPQAPPPFFRGLPHHHGGAHRKPPPPSRDQRGNFWRPPSSSNSPPLPSCPTTTKEDAEFKALGLCCSPTKEDEVALGKGSSEEGQKEGLISGSNNSEDSNGGSDCSEMKSSSGVNAASKTTDVKRKQHNARRSRVRKLQYIAELERSVQALQVEGAEVSAQLEFLDQQNLILGMENRALKQRLDNISQEHVIKSLEQEILDRELARLQYLYHMQNVNHHQHRQRHQKQHTSVHRRGRSCDIDSQFAKLSMNPTEVVPTSNGFKDLPLRN